MLDIMIKKIARTYNMEIDLLEPLKVLADKEGRSVANLINRIVRQFIQTDNKATIQQQVIKNRGVKR